MDKYEKAQAIEWQVAIAKQFIIGIGVTKNWLRTDLDLLTKELKETKDRLSFQDLIIKYFSGIDFSKLSYTLGISTYHTMTSEKEWKDYRGHFLYLLSTMDFERK